MRNKIAYIIAAALAAVLVSGCGEESGLSNNKPSPAEVVDEGQWVPSTTPDGDKVWCFFYAEDGAYASWLAFTCVPRAAR